MMLAISLLWAEEELKSQALREACAVKTATETNQVFGCESRVPVSAGVCCTFY
jgi:hypothetical protein